MSSWWSKTLSKRSRSCSQSWCLRTRAWLRLSLRSLCFSHWSLLLLWLILLLLKYFSSLGRFIVSIVSMDATVKTSILFPGKQWSSSCNRRWLNLLLLLLSKLLLWRRHLCLLRRVNRSTLWHCWLLWYSRLWLLWLWSNCLMLRPWSSSLLWRPWSVLLHRSRLWSCGLLMTSG